MSEYDNEDEIFIINENILNKKKKEEELSQEFNNYNDVMKKIFECDEKV